MLDFEALLRKKQDEAKAAANQKAAPMPHANLNIPKVDRIKQFFEDRQYDDVPFKLEGPANMRAVQDENMKTFNIINETNNQHPYDAYFQRKRPDDRSDS